MNHPPHNDNGNDNDDPDNAAAVADEDHNEDEDEDDDAICTEAMTLLQNRLNFPSRLRDRTMVRFAQQFITNVKRDIHAMLTDTRIEEYDGLDSERDTEEEVATAIRSCPEVLTQRDELNWLYPFRCVTFVQDDGNAKIMGNVKAVSFIPLFIQLAMECNSFPNRERGGGY